VGCLGALTFDQQGVPAGVVVKRRLGVELPPEAVRGAGLADCAGEV
jgi:hypothetical protein